MRQHVGLSISFKSEFKGLGTLRQAKRIRQCTPLRTINSTGTRPPYLNIQSLFDSHAILHTKIKARAHEPDQGEKKFPLFQRDRELLLPMKVSRNFVGQRAKILHAMHSENRL
jgi:hypothetical protein